MSSLDRRQRYSVAMERRNTDRSPMESLQLLSYTEATERCLIEQPPPKLHQTVLFPPPAYFPYSHTALNMFTQVRVARRAIPTYQNVGSMKCCHPNHLCGFFPWPKYSKEISSIYKNRKYINVSRKAGHWTLF